MFYLRKTKRIAKFDGFEPRRWEDIRTGLWHLKWARNVWELLRNRSLLCEILIWNPEINNSGYRNS